MKKRVNPLAPQVLEVLKKHYPPTPEPLLIAVSGGPDSTCLIHILAQIREELGRELHLVHLNHQLRDEDSAGDARYVKALARRLGIKASVAARDVEAYQAQHRLSLEEAAREVRYAFFKETAQALGSSQVATGHTRDDNVETILLHLIRGSGTRGLKGLSESSELKTSAGRLTIIRPLLGISREETQKYCREHNLEPRLDSSNLSLSPLRNRIRLKLLPRLKSYNPRIAEALLRTARIATDDYIFLEQETNRRYQEIVRTVDGVITLDKADFMSLPPALKRGLIQKALENLSGHPKDIEARHVEGVLDAAALPAGRSLNLPGGIIFAIDYDRYLIGEDPWALSPLPPLEKEFQLKVPGTTRLPGWQVEANISNRGEATSEVSDFSAQFDASASGEKLVVRQRRRGDRFQPLGMEHSKKIGEFMIDNKIPRHWRKNVPIVATPEQLIWVVGWRIDDRVKVTDQTERVLELRFKRC